MDWFLYDRYLHHERVTRVLLSIALDTLNIPLQSQQKMSYFLKFFAWCPPSFSPPFMPDSPPFDLSPPPTGSPPPPLSDSHSPQFPLGCIFKDFSQRFNQFYGSTRKYQKCTQKITKIDSFSIKLQLNMIQETSNQLKSQSIKRTQQRKFNTTFVYFSE